MASENYKCTCTRTCMCLKNIIIIAQIMWCQTLNVQPCTAARLVGHHQQGVAHSAYGTTPTCTCTGADVYNADVHVNVHV